MTPEEKAYQKAEIKAINKIIEITQDDIQELNFELENNPNCIKNEILSEIEFKEKFIAHLDSLKWMRGMKVIIAGSRGFNDYIFLRDFCDRMLSDRPNIEIVSGTANGADKLGERYAEETGYPIKKFPADWDKYGKSAGYKRNTQMAEYADVLIAFWDGKSKGTKHMIDLAKKNDLEVKVVKY